jgi:WD40 repeat protein
MHHLAGFDTSRRGAIHCVNPNTILYIAGNALIEFDLTTKVRKYVMGLDGEAVGAFSMHPNKELIAVGGAGVNPNIYVYTYPKFEIVRVLKGGTERGFSGLDWTSDGGKLASVGSSPDYLLTVWDWNNSRITLHTKAFGQDVFKVNFSKDDPGRLVTCGAGHVRFWEMAKTFTGLKLQGEIGKFGKIDLSDIEVSLLCWGGGGGGGMLNCLVCCNILLTLSLPTLPPS